MYYAFIGNEEGMRMVWASTEEDLRAKLAAYDIPPEAMALLINKSTGGDIRVPLPN